MIAALLVPKVPGSVSTHNRRDAGMKNFDDLREFGARVVLILRNLR